MKESASEITTATTTAAQATQEPFFGKQGGGGFFEGAKTSNAPLIQAKLTINEPGDMYEQEADKMADQVVQRLAMPGQEREEPLSVSGYQPPAAIQAKCEACEQEEEIQRKEEEPEEQEEIQRQTESATPSTPGDEAGGDLSSRLSASKGGGSPLPKDTRADMESAFGADFSGVRIHTGSEAAGMSKNIHAQAFTHGSDIYFNEGKFDGGSTEGRRLLAHELVHTIQQNGNRINRAPDVTHEAGKDYNSGKITAAGKTQIKQSDFKTNITDAKTKNPFYFNKDDEIMLIGTSSNQMWIEVKGTAHYDDAASKTPLDVPDTQGWISRRSTTMTLGLFEDLGIKDETSTKAGKISTGGSMGKVSAIVLHQTDSSTAKSTLSQYEAQAAQKVGAQYLIGEKGQIHLVVPLNERVGQAVGNRAIYVAEPKVGDPKKVTDEEMKSIRTLISNFYNTLDTEKIISKDLHDYWTSMDSQSLYNELKANNWQINAHITNSTSIGIEVVTRHTNIYKRERFSDKKKQDYSKADMALVKAKIQELVTAKKITEEKKKEVLRIKDQDDIKNSNDKKKYPDDNAKNNAIEKIDEEVYYKLKSSRWKVGGYEIYKVSEAPDTYSELKKQNGVEEFLNKMKTLNLSPQLKEQLLKTEKRNMLNKEINDIETSDTRKAEIEKYLDALNKELFVFIEAYDFQIYEDVSGTQKYAMWMLTKKLTQNYKLDPNRQVVGHEDVDKKTVGEGQSQAEFIRSMSGFMDNMRMIKGFYLIADKADKEIITKKWGYELDIFNALENGEMNNAAVLDFFDNYYVKVESFNKSGAILLIDLYKKLSKL